MRRGFGRHCPACGEGRLFLAFTRVASTCSTCGLDLSHQRADDAPPYFTIFVVGHLIVPPLLLLEKFFEPPTWAHLMLWVPLALALTFWFLPRIKGAVVGMQWALGMHGFGGQAE